MGFEHCRVLLRFYPSWYISALLLALYPHSGSKMRENTVAYTFDSTFSQFRDLTAFMLHVRLLS